MATFAVTNLNDSGAGSLRQAILDANADAGADVIAFAPGLAGGTIRLTQASALYVTQGATINGDINNDGRPDVTVDGRYAASRFGITSVFSVTTSAAVNLEGLVITGASGGQGVRGGNVNLTIENSIITGNEGPYRGSGVGVSSGALTIIDSTISGNLSVSRGGGVYMGSGTLDITGSTISANTGGSGGGVFLNNAILHLTNSTIHGNHASTFGGALRASAGTIYLMNSTVTSNTSGDGYGGLSLVTGTLHVTNSLVLGNYGPGDMDDVAAPTIVDTASIIGGVPADIFAATISGTGGGVLADNGGKVRTVALKANAANPALDASGAGATANDARGEAAVDIFGLGNELTNFRDLGAFELVAGVETPSLVVTITDDIVNPFDNETSLREAIAFANSNPGTDTVIFAGSVGEVFEGGGTASVTNGQLVITNDVIIDGDVDADGSPDVTIDAFANSRVFETSAATTFKGLIITGGYTTGDDEDGGAILATGAGDLVIQDSLVHFNGTSGDTAQGGAIHAVDANIIVNNSTISNNTTHGRYSYGGAIYGVSGDVTVTGSTISGNSTAGQNSEGGAIYSTAGAVSLTNSTLSGNSTSGQSSNGGGIFSYVGGVTLTDSTVSGNSANGTGGGIFTRDSGVTLTNSTVSGNSANGAGGGISTRDSGVTLTNSTVSGNSTSAPSSPGGGIFTGGTATLINSTVSGNSTSGITSAGGGIYARVAATLINSTVTGNSISGQASYGGGIVAPNGTLNNSIVVGNVDSYGSPTSDEIYGLSGNVNSIIGGDATTIFASTAEVIDGNGASTGIQAGVLADNGGPVQTVALKDDPSNPALDTGDVSVPGTPATDARGLGRVDFPGIGFDGMSFLDLGAFELQGLSPVLSGLAGDVVTFTEGNFLVAADDGGDAVVTDVDSANFEGGTLTVEIVAGGVPAQDQIGVVGGAIVQTTGGTITVSGVSIGTFTGGSNGNPYVITFNAEATPERVSLVLPLIGYRNANGSNPTEGDRTLEFTITDGDGGSDTVTSTVQVVAVNDPPRVDLNGTGFGANGINVNSAYSEDNGPTVLAPVARVIDNDSNIAAAAVVITSGFQPGTDILTIDGFTAGTVGVINFLYYSTTGTLFLTGPGTPAEYQALIRKVAFSSLSNDPGTARQIEFGAFDGTDPSPIAIASVTVTPVNDAPNFSIGADETVLEDSGAQSVAGFVTGIDAIEAGQTAGITSVSNDNNALFLVQPSVDVSGTLSYTPSANASGSALVTITVMDDGGTDNGGNDTTSLSFFINVTPVSDAPSGTDKAVGTQEDTSYTFTVADFGFSDPDDSPADDFAAVKIATLPAAGSLRLSGVAVTAGQEVSVADITAGLLRFVPAANGNGAGYASFTFQVKDDGGTDFGGVDTDPVPNTMTINVASVNDLPVAPATNSVVTNEDAASAAVAIGASDVDGDVLTYSLKPGSEPSVGSVSFAGGSFVYTPFGNVNGSDSFVILIDDGKGGVIEQAVSVTIAPVPDAPFAVDDTVAAAGPGLATSIPVATLLANDFDLDGDPLSLTSVSNATGGTVSLVSGTVVFTPTPGFVGEGGFDYAISSADGSSSAHVTITGVVGGAVSPANQPPAIAPVALAVTLEDIAVQLTVSASDPDGDVLAFAASDGAHGTVTGGSGGVFVYTPAAGYVGTDSFTVSVSDGKGGTASRTVDVTVLDLPDTADWTVHAPDRHVSELGGTGLYMGTAGFQQITVLDLPGLITFDSSAAITSLARLFIPGGTQTYGPIPGGSPSEVIGTNAAERISLAADANAVLDASFVRDNDTLVILGPSSDYAVAASVAGVIITSAAGAHIRIPAFASDGGVTLEFADVTLQLTTTDGETFQIGSQTIGAMPGLIGSGVAPVGLSPGTLVYRGGDLIELAGDAADWRIVETGGAALLTDGDTHVLVPLGASGVLLSFDDGPRTLALDPHTQSAMIGTQVLGEALTGITAPAQAIALPGTGSPSVEAMLELATGGEVTAGGTFAVMGTDGAEHVTMLHGMFTFDDSFGHGNDMLTLDAATSAFTAVRDSASAVLDSATLDAKIPGGSSGTPLTFTNGTHDLVYLTDTDTMTLGTQTITNIAAPLIV